MPLIDAATALSLCDDWDREERFRRARPAGWKDAVARMVVAVEGLKRFLMERGRDTHWLTQFIVYSETAKPQIWAEVGGLVHDARDLAQIELVAKQQAEPTGISQMDGFTDEAKCLAVLVEHPDWNKTEIAKHVGVQRTQLNRFEVFKKAFDATKAANLPRGSKYNGDVEAVAEFEDE